MFDHVYVPTSQMFGVSDGDFGFHQDVIRNVLVIIRASVNLLRLRVREPEERRAETGEEDEDQRRAV